MTKQEKVMKLRVWCDTKDNLGCDKCIFGADGEKAWCANDSNWGANCPDEILDDALERIAALKEPTSVAQEHDSVNHPFHYCQEGAMESIDEMVLIFGKEAVMHFCMCNAWKYRYRAMYKNGEEDMKKSHWYIRKYKELSESV